MKHLRVIVMTLFGLGILAATIFATIMGVNHPTARSTVAVALLGSIGVPIGLGALTTTWRWKQGPNASELRQEAEAKRRAAAALDDAEAAETIKAEMEAYVELRARRLEIDRRRDELASAVRAVVELRQELEDAEVKLGINVTQLDPRTVETLEELMRTRPKIKVPPYAGTLPGTASALDLLIQTAVKEGLRIVERRRARRLARLAPDALMSEDARRSTSPDPWRAGTGPADPNSAENTESIM